MILLVSLRQPTFGTVVGTFFCVCYKKRSSSRQTLCLCRHQPPCIIGIRTQALTPAPTPASTKGTDFSIPAFIPVLLQHQLPAPTPGHRDPHRHTALQTNYNAIAFKNNSRDSLRHRLAPTHGVILDSVILWCVYIIRCSLRPPRFRAWLSYSSVS